MGWRRHSTGGRDIQAGTRSQRTLIFGVSEWDSGAKVLADTVFWRALIFGVSERDGGTIFLAGAEC